MNNNLILIDGSLLLYRAYYALPCLFNKQGHPMNAIYGFISIFKKIINLYVNSNIVVIFDSPGNSFRKKIFNQYKQQRKKMPNNLIIQKQKLYKIIQYMGYQVISIKNVEADDIIGTLALTYIKYNFLVFIVSLDKDFAQLVSNYIFLLNPITFKILKSEDVYHKYGVYPQLISDLLALSGDYTDNIPGIPGIGIKTAQLLLNNFGNLISIYKNIDQIFIPRKKNIHIQLMKYKKKVFFYHQLTKINTNIYLEKKFLINIKNS
ncbi:5'-3' exonuclease [Enterobacteriaceae endosymbiont of Neohaemonia nigricornis]|uniref:5'-3' exonuclease n=1 Tax=Enterobacteriaceae endosymbiont of Neohaemonia nigricornis TaxID=2675792 RepID=UPI0014491F2D|nr:5'-3' exonuclease H3TH domain-containing protein [Enterobacteriaceae endosymbiont of Neohaemonia nigricornis]QJC30564.1 hypothetical protein GJT85_01980 [Enterobacteriaceae endosymbiont of Neohaemonia nigricornis]